MAESIKDETFPLQLMDCTREDSTETYQMDCEDQDTLYDILKCIKNTYMDEGQLVASVSLFDTLGGFQNSNSTRNVMQMMTMTMLTMMTMMIVDDDDGETYTLRGEGNADDDDVDDGDDVDDDDCWGRGQGRR